ncbi:MAG: helix-turn-helix transcriptional regulator [Opitutaceae bacterium]|nr:helix-turn-helix transcriptional regulator [Opitutaceae bacterium]
MRKIRLSSLSDRINQHHIAVTRLKPRQRSELHTHDFCEVFLVEEGQGLHLWNGRQLPLSPGCAAWIWPEDTHAYEAGSGQNLVFINLAIPLAHWIAFESLLRHAPDAAAPWAGSPRGHRRLDELEASRCARALHELLERGASDRHLLPQAMTVMAEVLLEHTTAATHGTGVPEWLEGWRRSMFEPELLRRPIAFWQKRAGVSPAHLSRTCRRFYGMSPTELLNRSRVDWVQRRLRAGEHKGVELALDAGFENLGFFYRCFKRYTGCTPRQWLLRQGETVPVG